MAWTERYVSVAGGGAHDGTSEADAWTLAEAIAGSGAGQRINVKAGTYSNTTTDRTFGNGAGAATTTAPKWWRGYKTTIGDMDSAPTSTLVAGTDIPLWSFTTGFLNITGVHQSFSNIAVSGARTAGQTFLSGQFNRYHRCRFENTAANSGAFAVQNTSGTNGTSVLTNCYFKATSTASVVVDQNDDAAFIGCVFEGGGDGLDVTTSIVSSVMFCVFNNHGGDGINVSSTVFSLEVINCSFYSCGGNGIDFAAIPITFAVVAGSIFSECGAYGINNSTGTNTNVISRHGNLFHSNTSGSENGFGDSPAWYQLSDGSSPFTNAGSSDFTLVTGSSGKGEALPGLFENQSYRSYLDTGAVQRQESSGGGSGGAFIYPGSGRFGVRES